jgi:hypothetical protein
VAPGQPLAETVLPRDQPLGTATQRGPKPPSSVCLPESKTDSRSGSTRRSKPDHRREDATRRLFIGLVVAAMILIPMIPVALALLSLARPEPQWDDQAAQQSSHANAKTEERVDSERAKEEIEEEPAEKATPQPERIAAVTFDLVTSCAQTYTIFGATPCCVGRIGLVTPNSLTKSKDTAENCDSRIR